MGLDIYKIKVVDQRTFDNTIPSLRSRLEVLESEMNDNKSLKDLLLKFQKSVLLETTEVIDLISTAKKNSIPDDWFFSGVDYVDYDNQTYAYVFENDERTEKILVSEVDVVIINSPVYVLLGVEVGYQRKNCTGNMFDEFFGGGDEYYGIHFTASNEVLDVAKTYTNEGSPMETWVLSDDEYIDFSF